MQSDSEGPGLSKIMPCSIAFCSSEEEILRPHIPTLVPCLWMTVDMDGDVMMY